MSGRSSTSSCKPRWPEGHRRPVAEGFGEPPVRVRPHPSPAQARRRNRVSTADAQDPAQRRSLTNISVYRICRHSPEGALACSAGNAPVRRGRKDENMNRYDLSTATVADLLVDPEVIAIVERFRPGLSGVGGREIGGRPDRRSSLGVGAALRQDRGFEAVRSALEALWAPCVEHGGTAEAGLPDVPVRRCASQRFPGSRERVHR
jgi:hypothetical protein